MFCTQYTIDTPFPVTEQLLCYFSAFLADQNLSPQTVKSYLAAVRNMQISLGFPDPRDQSSMPMLKRIQAGIRRVRMEKGSKSRIRLPITLTVLGKIHQQLITTQHPHRQLLWAISALAFFGFFRLGELLPERSTFNHTSNLAWGDVAIDNHATPTMVQVHLKKSKCDQFGSGSDVVVGRTGSELCPVQATLAYVQKRGNARGPFFYGKWQRDRHEVVVCLPVAGSFGGGRSPARPIHRP